MTIEINGAAAKSAEDGVAALRALLEKLSAVLIEENRLLEESRSGDHSSFISTKNQILKELMMVQKSISLALLPDGVLSELRSARQLVDRNHRLLGLQVRALNDVTTFITKAAMSETGDGTYSRDRQ